MTNQELEQNDAHFPEKTGSERITVLERYGISPILFAFISLILIFILYQIIGGIVTFIFFGLKPSADKVTPLRVATGLGQLLLILLPTLILVRFVSIKPKQYLRLNIPSAITLIVPLIGIFSLQQMLGIYMTFQERIHLPESLQAQIEEFKEMMETMYRFLVVSKSPLELLFVIFIIALIPAVTEELLFRGLILRSFESRLTSLKSVLLSGFIFGIYHLNPFGLIPLAAIGIYLGFLAVRSGNIWVPVATHFYNNAIACIAMYFNYEENFIVIGDINSLSDRTLIMIFVVFGLIFTLSTYAFIRITGQKELKSILTGENINNGV